MTTLVLDASVAAKWALPASAEPLHSEANHLLKEYVAGRIRFVVPDLFWVEIGNFLRKAIRMGRASEAAVQSALRAMLDRRFPTFPSAAMLEEAFSIAIRFDCAVYDTIYVALAVSSRTELITADERLAKALAARFPVKWLGLF